MGRSSSGRSRTGSEVSGSRQEKRRSTIDDNEPTSTTTPTRTRSRGESAVVDESSSKRRSGRHTDQFDDHLPDTPSRRQSSYSTSSHAPSRVNSSYATAMEREGESTIPLERGENSRRERDHGHRSASYSESSRGVKEENYSDNDRRSGHSRRESEKSSANSKRRDSKRHSTSSGRSDRKDGRRESQTETSRVLSEQDHDAALPQNQFPGAFPEEYTEPYRPPGHAADYYGDQGESVQYQPGVRTEKPSIIERDDQAHLQEPSIEAKPPPEPSSVGLVGAAASYFDMDTGNDASATTPTRPSLQISSSQPLRSPRSTPDPSHTMPTGTRPAGSVGTTGSVGTAAAAGAAAGLASSYYSGSSTTQAQQQSSFSQNYQHSTQQHQHDIGSQNYYATGLGVGHESPGQYSQGIQGGHLPPSRPSKHDSFGPGVGTAAAAGLAAAGATAYYTQHHSQHSPSYTHSHFQGQNGSYPSGPDPNFTLGQNNSAFPIVQQQQRLRHKHRGPLGKFVDWFRDPHGVAQFEAYTEAIGVCKYCFDPNSTPLEAPRKHHYHHGGPSNVNPSGVSTVSRVSKKYRHSNGSSSSLSSSDAERRRKKSSIGKKVLAAGIAGVGAAKIGEALYKQKHDFDDTYSVRTGIPQSEMQQRMSMNAARIDAQQHDRFNEAVTSETRHSKDSRYESTEDMSLRRKSSTSSRKGRRDSDSERRRPSRTHASAASPTRLSRGQAMSIGAGAAVLGAAALTSSEAGQRHHGRSRSRSKSRSRSPPVVKRKKSYYSKRISPRHSYVDLGSKNTGPLGFGNFFSSPSANQKKGKKSKGFFAFRNDSSSSSDADLAFGEGTVKRKTSKKGKGRRDSGPGTGDAAAILGLAATGAALAAESHRRESKRKSKYGSTDERLGPESTSRLSVNKKIDLQNNDTKISEMNDDGAWEDLSDADSGLAYGGRLSAKTSRESLAEQGTSKWAWRWNRGKDKRRSSDAERRQTEFPQSSDAHTFEHGATAAASIAAGMGVAVAADAIAHQSKPDQQYSQYAHSAPSPANLPPMQYVDPFPTSNPAYFEARQQTPMTDGPSPHTYISQSPIPLKQPQPQPYPVSLPTDSIVQSAVLDKMEAKAELTGSPEEMSSSDSKRMSRRIRTESEDRARPGRHNTSPPPLNPSHSSRNSVMFALTDEQLEAEKRADEEYRRRQRRREEKNRRHSTDSGEQQSSPPEMEVRKNKPRTSSTLDREEREKRRAEIEEQLNALYAEEKRRLQQQKDLEAYRKNHGESGGISAAVVGAGVGAATAVMLKDRENKKNSESDKSETDGRPRRKSSLKRSSMDRVPSPPKAVTPPRAPSPPAIVQPTPRRSSPPRAQSPIEESQQDRMAKMTARRIARTPSPVHEDYGKFFVPEELAEKVQEHNEAAENRIHDLANVITINPDAEYPSQPRFDPFVYKPYGSSSKHDSTRFGWHVPFLELVEPTPPGSRSASKTRERDVEIDKPVSPAKDVPVATAQPKDSSESLTDSDSPRPAEPIEGPSNTGSRVTWGPHDTYEFEVQSPISERNEPLSDHDELKKFLPLNEEASDMTSTRPVHNTFTIESDEGTYTAKNVLPFDQIVPEQYEYASRENPLNNLPSLKTTTEQQPEIEKSNGPVIEDRRPSPSPEPSPNAEVSHEGFLDNESYKPPFSETVSDLGDIGDYAHREIPKTGHGFIDGPSLPSTPAVDVPKLPEKSLESITEPHPIAVEDVPTERRESRSQRRRYERALSSSENVTPVIHTPEPSYQNPQEHFNEQVVTDKHALRAQPHEPEHEMPQVSNEMPGGFGVFDYLVDDEGNPMPASSATGYETAVRSVLSQQSQASAQERPKLVTEQTSPKPAKLSRSMTLDDSKFEREPPKLNEYTSDPEDWERRPGGKSRSSKGQSSASKSDVGFGTRAALTGAAVGAVAAATAAAAVSAEPDFYEREKDKSRDRKKKKRESEMTDDYDLKSNASSTTKDEDKKSKRRSKRDSDNYNDDDDTKSVVSMSTMRDEDTKSKRRSKRDSDNYNDDDDTKSVTSMSTTKDEDKKSRRKKRDSDVFKFDDDTRSVTSASSEKRRSKSKEIEKKPSSGGLFSSLFNRGSDVSASSKRSGKSSKSESRAEREKDNNEEDREKRKKRRSKGDSYYEEDVPSAMSEPSRSSGRSKSREPVENDTPMQQSRDVSVDDSFVSADEEQETQSESFLAERPDMPTPTATVTAMDTVMPMGTDGVSGLKSEGLGVIPFEFGYDGDIVEEALPIPENANVEKHLEHAVVEGEKPSTAEPDPEQTLATVTTTPKVERSRRLSTIRTAESQSSPNTTQSPTAVPVFFGRRHPVTPSSNIAPNPTKSSPALASLSSPLQTPRTRQGRPKSYDFSSSRGEYRPLYLVESHSASKAAPVPAEEDLPSLPSSRTSSAHASTEDLRGQALALLEGRENSDLPLLGEVDTDFQRPSSPDFLDSRSATPVPGDHQRMLDREEVASLPMSVPNNPRLSLEEIKERKAKQREREMQLLFHSPSELLQDPHDNELVQPQDEDIPEHVGRASSPLPSVVSTSQDEEFMSAESGLATPVYAETRHMRSRSTSKNRKRGRSEERDAAFAAGLGLLSGAAAGIALEKAFRDGVDEHIKGPINSDAATRDLPVEESVGSHLIEQQQPEEISDFEFSVLAKRSKKDKKKKNKRKNLDLDGPTPFTSAEPTDISTVDPMASLIAPSPAPGIDVPREVSDESMPKIRSKALDDPSTEVAADLEVDASTTVQVVPPEPAVDVRDELVVGVAPAPGIDVSREPIQAQDLLDDTAPIHVSPLAKSTPKSFVEEPTAAYTETPGDVWATPAKKGKKDKRKQRKSDGLGGSSLSAPSVLEKLGAEANVLSADMSMIAPAPAPGINVSRSQAQETEAIGAYHTAEEQTAAITSEIVDDLNKEAVHRGILADAHDKSARLPANLTDEAVSQSGSSEVPTERIENTQDNSADEWALPISSKKSKREKKPKKGKEKATKKENEYIPFASDAVVEALAKEEQSPVAPSSTEDTKTKSLDASDLAMSLGVGALAAVGATTLLTKRRSKSTEGATEEKDQAEIYQGEAHDENAIHSATEAATPNSTPDEAKSQSADVSPQNYTDLPELTRTISFQPTPAQLSDPYNDLGAFEQAFERALQTRGLVHGVTRDEVLDSFLPKRNNAPFVPKGGLTPVPEGTPSASATPSDAKGGLSRKNSKKEKRKDENVRAVDKDSMIPVVSSPTIVTRELPSQLDTEPAESSSVTSALEDNNPFGSDFEIQPLAVESDSVTLRLDKNPFGSEFEIKSKEQDDSEVVSNNQSTALMKDEDQITDVLFDRRHAAASQSIDHIDTPDHDEWAPASKKDKKKKRKSQQVAPPIEELDTPETPMQETTRDHNELFPAQESGRTFEEGPAAEKSSLVQSEAIPMVADDFSWTPTSKKDKKKKNKHNQSSTSAVILPEAETLADEQARDEMEVLKGPDHETSQSEKVIVVDASAEDLPAIKSSKKSKKDKKGKAFTASRVDDVAPAIAIASGIAAGATIAGMLVSTDGSSEVVEVPEKPDASGTTKDVRPASELGATMSVEDRADDFTAVAGKKDRKAKKSKKKSLTADDWNVEPSYKTGGMQDIQNTAWAAEHNTKEPEMIQPVVPEIIAPARDTIVDSTLEHNGVALSEDSPVTRMYGDIERAGSAPELPSEPINAATEETQIQVTGEASRGTDSLLPISTTGSAEGSFDENQLETKIQEATTADDEWFAPISAKKSKKEKKKKRQSAISDLDEPLSATSNVYIVEAPQNPLDVEATTKSLTENPRSFEGTDNGTQPMTELGDTSPEVHQLEPAIEDEWAVTAKSKKAKKDKKKKRQSVMWEDESTPAIASESVSAPGTRTPVEDIVQTTEPIKADNEGEATDTGLGNEASNASIAEDVSRTAHDAQVELLDEQRPRSTMPESTQATTYIPTHDTISMESTREFVDPPIWGEQMESQQVDLEPLTPPEEPILPIPAAQSIDDWTAPQNFSKKPAGQVRAPWDNDLSIGQAFGIAFAGTAATLGVAAAKKKKSSVKVKPGPSSFKQYQPESVEQKDGGKALFDVKSLEEVKDDPKAENPAAEINPMVVPEDMLPTQGLENSAKDLALANKIAPARREPTSEEKPQPEVESVVRSGVSGDTRPAAGTVKLNEIKLSPKEQIVKMSGEPTDEMTAGIESASVLPFVSREHEDTTGQRLLDTEDVTSANDSKLNYEEVVPTSQSETKVEEKQVPEIEDIWNTSSFSKKSKKDKKRHKSLARDSSEPVLFVEKGEPSESRELDVSRDEPGTADDVTTPTAPGPPETEHTAEAPADPERPWDFGLSKKERKKKRKIMEAEGVRFDEYDQPLRLVPALEDSGLETTVEEEDHQDQVLSNEFETESTTAAKAEHRTEGTVEALEAIPALADVTSAADLSEFESKPKARAAIDFPLKLDVQQEELAETVTPWDFGLTKKERTKKMKAMRKDGIEFDEFDQPIYAESADGPTQAEIDQIEAPQSSQAHSITDPATPVQELEEDRDEWAIPASGKKGRKDKKKRKSATISSAESSNNLIKEPIDDFEALTQSKVSEKHDGPPDDLAAGLKTTKELETEPGAGLNIAEVDDLGRVDDDWAVLLPGKKGKKDKNKGRSAISSPAEQSTTATRKTTEDLDLPSEPVSLKLREQNDDGSAAVGDDIDKTDTANDPSGTITKEAEPQDEDEWAVPSSSKKKKDKKKHKASTSALVAAEASALLLSASNEDFETTIKPEDIEPPGTTQVTIDPEPEVTVVRSGETDAQPYLETFSDTRSNEDEWASQTSTKKSKKDKKKRKSTTSTPVEMLPESVEELLQDPESRTEPEAKEVTEEISHLPDVQNNILPESTTTRDTQPEDVEDWTLPTSMKKNKKDKKNRRSIVVDPAEETGTPLSKSTHTLQDSSLPDKLDPANEFSLAPVVQSDAVLVSPMTTDVPSDEVDWALLASSKKFKSDKKEHQTATSPPETTVITQLEQTTSINEASTKSEVPQTTTESTSMSKEGQRLDATMSNQLHLDATVKETEEPDTIVIKSQMEEIPAIPRTVSSDTKSTATVLVPEQTEASTLPISVPAEYSSGKQTEGPATPDMEQNGDEDWLQSNKELKKDKRKRKSTASSGKATTTFLDDAAGLPKLGDALEAVETAIQTSEFDQSSKAPLPTGASETDSIARDAEPDMDDNWAMPIKAKKKDKKKRKSTPLLPTEIFAASVEEEGQNFNNTVIDRPQSFVDEPDTMKVEPSISMANDAITKDANSQQTPVEKSASTKHLAFDVTNIAQPDLEEPLSSIQTPAFGTPLEQADDPIETTVMEGGFDEWALPGKKSKKEKKKRKSGISTPADQSSTPAFEDASEFMSTETGFPQATSAGMSDAVLTATTIPSTERFEGHDTKTDDDSILPEEGFTRVGGDDMLPAVDEPSVPVVEESRDSMPTEAEALKPVTRRLTTAGSLTMGETAAESITEAMEGKLAESEDMWALPGKKSKKGKKQRKSDFSMPLETPATPIPELGNDFSDIKPTQNSVEIPIDAAGAEESRGIAKDSDQPEEDLWTTSGKKSKKDKKKSKSGASSSAEQREPLKLETELAAKQVTEAASLPKGVHSAESQTKSDSEIANTQNVSDTVAEEPPLYGSEADPVEAKDEEEWAVSRKLSKKEKKKRKKAQILDADESEVALDIDSSTIQQDGEVSQDKDVTLIREAMETPQQGDSPAISASPAALPEVPTYQALSERVIDQSAQDTMVSQIDEVRSHYDDRDSHPEPTKRMVPDSDGLDVTPGKVLDAAVGGASRDVTETTTEVNETESRIKEAQSILTTEDALAESNNMEINQEIQPSTADHEWGLNPIKKSKEEKKDKRKLRSVDGDDIANIATMAAASATIAGIAITGHEKNKTSNPKVTSSQDQAVRALTDTDAEQAVPNNSVMNEEITKVTGNAEQEEQSSDGHLETTTLMQEDTWGEAETKEQAHGEPVDTIVEDFLSEDTKVRDDDLSWVKSNKKGKKAKKGKRNSSSLPETPQSSTPTVANETIDQQVFQDPQGFGQATSSTVPENALVTPSQTPAAEQQDEFSWATTTRKSKKGNHRHSVVWADDDNSTPTDTGTPANEKPGKSLVLDTLDFDEPFAPAAVAKTEELAEEKVDIGTGTVSAEPLSIDVPESASEMERGKGLQSVEDDVAFVVKKSKRDKKSERSLSGPSEELSIRKAKLEREVQEQDHGLSDEVQRSETPTAMIIDDPIEAAYKPQPINEADQSKQAMEVDPISNEFDTARAAAQLASIELGKPQSEPGSQIAEIAADKAFAAAEGQSTGHEDLQTTAKLDSNDRNIAEAEEDEWAIPIKKSKKDKKKRKSEAGESSSALNAALAAAGIVGTATLASSLSHQAVDTYMDQEVQETKSERNLITPGTFVEQQVDVPMTESEETTKATPAFDIPEASPASQDHELVLEEEDAFTTKKSKKEKKKKKNSQAHNDQMTDDVDFGITSTDRLRASPSPPPVVNNIVSEVATVKELSNDSNEATVIEDEWMLPSKKSKKDKRKKQPIGNAAQMPEFVARNNDDLSTIPDQMTSVKSGDNFPKSELTGQATADTDAAQKDEAPIVGEDLARDTGIMSSWEMDTATEGVREVEDEQPIEVQEDFSIGKKSKKEKKKKRDSTMEGLTSGTEPDSRYAQERKNIVFDKPMDAAPEDASIIEREFLTTGSKKSKKGKGKKTPYAYDDVEGTAESSQQTDNTVVKDVLSEGFQENSTHDIGSVSLTTEPPFESAPVGKSENTRSTLVEKDARMAAMAVNVEPETEESWSFTKKKSKKDHKRKSTVPTRDAISDPVARDMLAANLDLGNVDIDKSFDERASEKQPIEALSEEQIHQAWVPNNEKAGATLLDRSSSTTENAESAREVRPATTQPKTELTFEKGKQPRTSMGSAAKSVDEPITEPSTSSHENVMVERGHESDGSNVSESTRDRRKRRRSPPLQRDHDPDDLPRSPRDRAMTPPPEHDDLMDTALGIAAGLGFGTTQNEEAGSNRSLTRSHMRDSGIQFDSPNVPQATFPSVRDSGYAASPRMERSWSASRSQPELPPEQETRRPSRPHSPTSSSEDVRAQRRSIRSEPEVSAWEGTSTITRPRESLETPVKRQPSPVEPTSKDRSSVLFNSSPAGQTPKTPGSTKNVPREAKGPESSSMGLHRTPSIHGHRKSKETLLPENQSSRPRRLSNELSSSLLHRSAAVEIDRSAFSPSPIQSPERPFSPTKTPLQTIPEGHPRHSDSTLLTLGALATGGLGTTVLAASSRDDPTAGPRSLGKSKSRTSSLRDLRGSTVSPFNGPDLQPTVSRAPIDEPSTVTEGTARSMADSFEGYGSYPASPKSPTRPPSVKKRQSMQQIRDLETKVEQLASENRSLAEAKIMAERHLEEFQLDRNNNDFAVDESLQTLNEQLRERDEEIVKLREQIEALIATHETLKSEHETRYSELHDQHSQAQTQWHESSRELEGLRSQHEELSAGMEDIVRHQIDTALAEKNSEVQRLRQDLDLAREKIRQLQSQILARGADEIVMVRDEDYFDNACQTLCQHVQQWVLRFSKFSDTRVCYATHEIRDEKVVDRFDNAILDGSDVDSYLSDRVKRRDIFMSVVMTMIWEYVFTRYLFGMDRDQRQKLKQLEKNLSEVGPANAVHQWRALTLTLLAKREAFRQQRESDSEAVVLEIMKTLKKLLPPPQNLEGQIYESLRKVMRTAVDLSIEMRTQKAEYIMLPPLQPEYDTNGDLARKVYFNASLMNERSGETSSNEELEASRAVVRIVLFPLVVKKGDDSGRGNEEIVVCPAQVLVARPDKGKRPKSRLASGGSDRMSVDQRGLKGASTHSLGAMSGMEMGSGNVI